MTIDLVWEWIKHLATPFPRHLRDMGYVEESRNLAARQDRCRAAWQAHLECTRSLILEAADRCRRFDKALIVGSGLLFDIPTAELSQRFRDVVLAGHPASLACSQGSALLWKRPPVERGHHGGR